MNSIPVPAKLRTERLYLRSWQPADAARLLPVLEANVNHLVDWIPPHVAAPAPVSEIELRLVGFAEDFQAGRSWRFALFSADQRDLFGEVDLFPRSAEGRVHFASADRMEIGYWLRSDVTGKGYATEAARAMLELAMTMPRVSRVEIHCDPRNAPSAAVPRRLGFRLERSGSGQPSILPEEPGGSLTVYIFDKSRKGIISKPLTIVTGFPLSRE